MKFAGLMLIVYVDDAITLNLVFTQRNACNTKPLRTLLTQAAQEKYASKHATDAAYASDATVKTKDRSGVCSCVAFVAFVALHPLRALFALE